MKPKSPDPEALRLRMAGLCSRSEQCSFDIAMKLRRAGLNASQSDEILRFLIENRFISDERFARQFAGYKTRYSGWGRYKTIQALKAKRIDSGLINDAVKAIDPANYEGAFRKALANKAKSLDLSQKEDAQKLYRYMTGRGFESSLIVPAIKELIRKKRNEND